RTAASRRRLRPSRPATRTGEGMHQPARVYGRRQGPGKRVCRTPAVQSRSVILAAALRGGQLPEGYAQRIAGAAAARRRSVSAAAHAGLTPAWVFQEVNAKPKGGAWPLMKMKGMNLTDYPGAAAAETERALEEVGQDRLEPEQRRHAVVVERQ